MEKNHQRIAVAASQLASVGRSVSFGTPRCASAVGDRALIPRKWLVNANSAKWKNQLMTRRELYIDVIALTLWTNLCMLILITHDRPHREIVHVYVDNVQQR